MRDELSRRIAALEQRDLERREMYLLAQARFEDVLARAREGDAEALEELSLAARELFGEGRELLTWRPAYKISAWAYKHGPRRVLRYGEALAMRGDGVVRREAR